MWSRQENDNLKISPEFFSNTYNPFTVIDKVGPKPYAKRKKIERKRTNTHALNHVNSHIQFMKKKFNILLIIPFGSEKIILAILGTKLNFNRDKKKLWRKMVRTRWIKISLTKVSPKANLEISYKLKFIWKTDFISLHNTPNF